MNSQTIHNPQGGISLKIRRSKTQLKTEFEKESVLLRNESRKQNWYNTTECKEYALTTIFIHLDIIFTDSLKDYLHLCVLYFFSGVIIPNDNGTNKQHASKRPYDVDEITSAMTELMAQNTRSTKIRFLLLQLVLMENLSCQRMYQVQINNYCR